MIRVIGVLLLFLLLGCNENEAKKDTEYKSKYDVLETSKFESIESKTNPIAILTLTYGSVVTDQEICDAFDSTVTDSKNKKYLEELMSSSLSECKFHRKLYEHVIPNFKNISLDNAERYYYFEYMTEESDINIANIVGIFSDINNCNNFKNEFLDNEIGFASNCKKIKLLD